MEGGIFSRLLALFAIACLAECSHREAALVMDQGNRLFLAASEGSLGGIGPGSNVTPTPIRRPASQPNFANSKSPTKSKVSSRATGRAVMIGDAFATSFHFGDARDKPWQLWNENGSNMFLDRDPGNGLDSLFEIVGRNRAVYFENLSRPNAVVFDSRSARGPLTNAMGAPRTLDEQVDSVLKEKTFPNLVILWTGHFNLDWVGAYHSTDLDNSEKRDALLKETREQFRMNYETQILKLLNRGVSEGKNFSLLVMGLGNLRSQLAARDEAERIRDSDPTLYSQLTYVKSLFPSLNEPYRATTFELLDHCNQDLRETLARLKKAYSGRSPRIFIDYSDEIAQAKIGLEQLDPQDAWTLNLFGQQLLAEKLYEAAQPALRFLGWMR